MLEVTPFQIVILSGLMFFIGLVGFIRRSNLIVMLIALELMFNAVNLNFVGFSYLLDDWNGQMFTIFIISIAACEAVIGLGIIIALYRHAANVEVDEVSLLRW